MKVDAVRDYLSDRRNEVRYAAIGSAATAGRASRAVRSKATA